MKVLKVIIRTILIIITSILITTWIFMVPITKIVFNQKEVVRILDNSDIYKNIDKEIKESMVESLNEALTEVPEDITKEIDTKELFDNIDTSSLLKGLTDGIIDIVYSVSEEELTLKDIVTKYNDEFDKYIKDNNIDIAEEDLNIIHNALSDETLNEALDDDEINNTLKDVKETVDGIKACANLVEVILIISIIVLTGIILLLSNNKINSMVILLSIPTVLLLLMEAFLSLLIRAGREEMGELLYGIVSSVKGSMFKYINTFIIVFILTIIGLIVFKKVRKNKKEKTINDNQNKANDKETN